MFLRQRNKNLSNRQKRHLYLIQFDVLLYYNILYIDYSKGNQLSLILGHARNRSSMIGLRSQIVNR